jgi:diguanylate cyclase (GGDEF)-like protein
MSIEKTAENIATYDSLTGLQNRESLLTELANDTIDNSGNFALVFVDVDGLKHTNDTYGHPAGDQLIVETSKILVDGLRTDQDQADEPRPTDNIGRGVFRLGGDEFVLKLNGVKTQEEVDLVINRLQTKLISEGSNGGIKASMGGRPHKAGESAERLLGDVDRRMYDQKKYRKDYEAQLKTHQSKANYRNEVSSLSSPKFWLHIGGVAINRATDRISGVKSNK